MIRARGATCNACISGTAAQRSTVGPSRRAQGPLALHDAQSTASPVRCARRCGGRALAMRITRLPAPQQPAPTRVAGNRRHCCVFQWI